MFAFWSLSSHSRISNSYGDVTIAGEGRQVLTCARHSWPLSSEGSSIAIPTVTRAIRLLWSSPRTRDTHNYWWAFTSGVATTCFLPLGLSRLGFKHPTFRLWGERSNPLSHHRGALSYGRSYKKKIGNNAVWFKIRSFDPFP